MLVGGVGRGIGGFPRAQSATAPMPQGGLLPKMHAASKEATMTTTPKPDLAEQALSTLRVMDAMHPGVLTCPVETPLRDVARMLAGYNVHCSSSSARTRNTRRARSGRGP